MERQDGFRGITKIAPVVKGSSTLNIAEFYKYDTSVYADELAKCSKKITRSKIANIISGGKGDGDVWVEKILTSTKTGQKKVFFVSKNTKRKVAGEPHSGAGRVLYLKPQYKQMKLTGQVRSPPKKKEIIASPTSVVAKIFKNMKILSNARSGTCASDVTNACVCPQHIYGRPSLDRLGQGVRHIRTGLERSGSNTRNILAEFLEADDPRDDDDSAV